ncbi:2-C-methyl-D-erythritol 4-phosphate cytidylyltransferase [Pelobacter sp. M08fum]|uniref:2-C-methyl-D-erythritol 4-phosphate cytidylyltransferase n=1 Tax=Pelovirga terrestris TaxID=2771352 RepID=A0A8J6UP09_9BACT|nr:2-C-methyl-D-erythritol 4-phosphate cytidylyltransferase [Pelovirga terrestris]
MKSIVLIPAAGSGRRMGTTTSKQYLELQGKPLLAHTIALFDQHPQVEAIYPIVPADDREYCQREILDRYQFKSVRRLIAGGSERQDSVRNGLAALIEDGYNQPRRPILIHDGARPLFNTDLLAALLKSIDANGACIMAVPAKDTIKQVIQGQIVDSPSRDQLWQAQTPQGFHFEILDKAFHLQASDEGPSTDDAALVAAAGYAVQVLAGEDRNIKITTPADLLIAAALLDSYQEKSA